MVADSPLSEYNPFSLVPQIVTITLTVLIIVVLFSVYYKKLTNSNYRRINSGYVLTMQIFIEYIRGLVVTILGPKLEKTTPFFLYLFSYILISNLIGVLGFANPTGSLTVTLSLAFLSVVGTFAVGFRFQRASYLRKFVYSARIKKKSIPVMINPFGVISSVTPLISLSFRL
jgi:F-type H+-transporting ATPase subunit a